MLYNLNICKSLITKDFIAYGIEYPAKPWDQICSAFKAIAERNRSASKDTAGFSLNSFKCISKEDFSMQYLSRLSRYKKKIDTDKVNDLIDDTFKIAKSRVILRRNSSCTSINCAVLDFDNDGKVKHNIETVSAYLDIKDINYIAYRTYSSPKKFRVILPYSETLEATSTFCMAICIVPTQIPLSSATKK